MRRRRIDKSWMRLGVALIAVVVVLAVGYFTWSARRELIVSHTVAFGRVAVKYVAQYVRENEGRWPGSWDDLNSLHNPPIVFERSDPSEMLETCRRRVEIDFQADPIELASQSVRQFDAIRPRDGYGVDYRESWNIDLLLDAIRESHPRPPARSTVGSEMRTSIDFRFRKTSQRNGIWKVKWTARLGSATFATPVVADGLVWIGTNNGDGKDPQGVLACFRESDGQLLYQFESPSVPNDVRRNHFGMGCTPLVDGDRIWFTTNRLETVCLDIAPLKRADGVPREIWNVDMRQTLGVFPRAIMLFWNSASMPCPDEAPSRTCSIASYQEFIYVITGNGVDDDRVSVPRPDAPSLVCFNRNTGEVVWQHH